MVCSSVAVVKITIVNWMKYHGYDVHMMLRERQRVREWITQSTWVRACRVWLLRNCMHICVSEGCLLLLVTKRQHWTASTEVFPDTWQSFWFLIYIYIQWKHKAIHIQMFTSWFAVKHIIFCSSILVTVVKWVLLNLLMLQLGNKISDPFILTGGSCFFHGPQFALTHSKQGLMTWS